MARKTSTIPDTLSLSYWVAEYKRYGFSFEIFLADCHEDNVPFSDEFIRAVWDNY